MFAPPDPSGLAARHGDPAINLPFPGAPAPVSPSPAPPSPVLPTLPRAMSAPAPVPAPTLPGVPEAPRPPTAMPYSADAVDGVADESAPLAVCTDPPSPLIRTRWLRRVTIWANVTVIPGMFVGDVVGASLVLLSGIALVAWSGVITTNAGRARRATRHGSAPHPVVAVLSWFIAPVVGLAAAVAISVVGSWAASGAFDQEGTRAMVLVAATVVAVLAVLIAAYRPYAVLARCAKWVNADGGRFRKWFAAPIVAAILAVVIQVLAGLIVLSDSADGSSSSASIGAVVLLAVSFTLPWVAWLVFGSRAMRSLEAGVEHAHGRSVREAQAPADASTVIAPSA